MILHDFCFLFHTEVVWIHSLRPVRFDGLGHVMWAIKRKGPWGGFLGFVGDGMLPSYISIMENIGFFFVAHVVKSIELWHFGRNPSFLFGSLERCVAKKMIASMMSLVALICDPEWLKDSRSVLSKTIANVTSRSTISQCLKNDYVMWQNCC